MEPTIGRIVHLRYDGQPCVPAVITEVNEYTCLLFVMQPRGTRWYFVAAPQGTEAGDWHWPEGAP